MKRLLIGTTALVSILAGAAFAEEDGPSVKIKGLLDFQGGTRKQHKGYNTDAGQNLTQNQRNYKFYSDARVRAEATNTAESGLKYGAVITLQTENETRTGRDSAQFDNTYLFLDSGMGRVELGSNYTAARAMRVSSCNISRGTGGVDCGYWNLYLGTNYIDPSNSANTANNTFVTNSGLAGDNFAAGIKEQTRKVTYYTPRINGFQVGFSYATDTANVGDGKLATNVQPRDIKNHMTAGLSYSNQFDQLSFNATLVGESGKGARLSATETGKHNLKGWEAGASVTYNEFSLAGSYGLSNKKFFQLAETSQSNNKDLKYWNVGAAYAKDAYGLSLNYLASNYQNNKTSAIGVSADYTIAPGMMPYAEATFFKLTNATDNGKTYPKNKGQVYLLGTVFTF